MKDFFFSAVMVLLIALTPHVRAEDNLYFHGELVAEPCVIPPGSEVIPLDFGTVIDKYLYSYINVRYPFHWPFNWRSAI